jgi:hypothetical protein
MGKLTSIITCTVLIAALWGCVMAPIDSAYSPKPGDPPYDVEVPWSDIAMVAIPLAVLLVLGIISAIFGPWTCACSTHGDAFVFDSRSRGCGLALEDVDLDGENWVRLGKCPVCDALWAYDVDPGLWNNRLPVRVAVRLQSEEEFRTSVFDERRGRCLVEHCGGAEEEPCVKAGCEKMRLKGYAFCEDHLWTSSNW